MPTEITITVDENLSRVPASRLMLLWHLAQANPAPHADHDAGALVEKIGYEIIRRWLRDVEPELYHHQGRSYYWNELCRFARYVPPPGANGASADFYQGQWVAKADVDALQPCPVPDAAAGADSCKHDAWPCRLTVLAWQIRGLDPDAERKRILDAERARLAEQDGEPR